MAALWLVFVVLPLFFLQLLYRKPKKAVEEYSVKTGSSVRLGIWRSLKISLMMLLYSKIPNYEIVDRKTREYSVSELALVDIPTRKEGLLVVVSLSVAKKIMSSKKWVDRFRHDYYMYYCTWNKSYGLLLGGGEYWREARALTLRILHKLEFFKQDNMERMTRRELEGIIEKLDVIIKRGGGDEGTFSPHQMFEVSMLNLVGQVCWSERFRETDYFVTTVIPILNRFNRVFNVGFSILELFPWISKLFPSLTFYGAYKEANDITVNYFKNVVREKRRLGTYRADPKDFTDYFLQEIDLRENPQVINDENFYITIRDLVWAGLDTTNSTLEYAILLLALKPEAQQRVQLEIDQILGRSATPTYADRARMPYTQATLHEIMRYGSTSPMAARTNTVDLRLGNVEIPKGTLCGISAFSIHRSPEIWKDPNEFTPERFLSADGKLINTEKIIPFGYGKRICIGESLARTFLFITLVSMLQRYEFRLSKHHPPPSLANIPGLSRCPVPYHVTVKTRP